MTVYSGKYLELDLDIGDWRDVPIAEDEIKTWLLGSGLAAKIYYDRLDIQIEPLDPKNPLLIFNGVLTGAFAPTACRSSWCGRSPLTGFWNESNMGNNWGAELRFSGYDGLVITGRSEKPVYLWINDNRIEIRDATHLWGKDYFETADLLLQETDPKAQVAGIGQAGERLVSIAGVLSGPSTMVRTAGRGGMGAVMGSKNLKAIVVRGKLKPTYPDLQRIREVVKRQNKEIKENSLAMSTYGTSGGVMSTEIKGDLPLRNWTLGNWSEAEMVSGQMIHKTIKVKHTHCFACPIGCGHQEIVSEGEVQVPLGHGLEYETIAGFGGNCQVSDLHALSLANSLCNRYGLDTISTSSVIAFAMEAFEKKLITRQETGGITLQFGDAAAMIAMVHQIGLHEKFGQLLGKGVRAAALEIGDGAAHLAMHVKGMEFAYHDPRAFVSMAVNYATANRGACHLEALSYWNGYGVLLPDLGYTAIKPYHESNFDQAKLAYDYQNYTSLFNPMGLCKFLIKGMVGPVKLVEIVNSALGWEWQPEDAITTGKRLFQLKRLINLELGLTPDDEKLPERLLFEPRPSGEAAGVTPDMEIMLPFYYSLRGWDKQGRPSAERLETLGLKASKRQ